LAKNSSLHSEQIIKQKIIGFLMKIKQIFVSFSPKANLV